MVDLTEIQSETHTWSESSLSCQETWECKQTKAFSTAVWPQCILRGMKDELPIDSTQSQVSQPILTPTRPAAAKLTSLETSVLASSRLINSSDWSAG